MNTLYHGRNQYLVLVNSPTTTNANINLSTDLMEASIPSGLDLGDVTTGGSVGHRWFSGLQKGSGSFKLVTGTGAANASWTNIANYAAMQQANPSNFWTANYGPGGIATNAPQLAFNFLIKEVSLPVKVADVVTMSVSFEINNGLTISNY